MTTLVVTGTGTDVGKTIVTAAIAAVARADGRHVTVVKPAQTGVAPGEDGDVAVVGRLSGVTDLHELARYPDPLAPATAARRAGQEPATIADCVRTIRDLPGDLVLVEGAGGLLVRLDAAGGTIADLALGLDAPMVVVAAAGLGTLNATALTCQAIRDRGLACLGVVVGSWPDEPDLASECNLTEIASYSGGPLLGLLPAGSGRLRPADFEAAARAGLAPELGGTWSR